MFSLSIRSKNRLEGVDDSLIEVIEHAITITSIDFGIPNHGGLRTALEQNKLYEDEQSKADGYMTISKHQEGNAIDFYAYIDGNASWKHEHLAFVATAILQSASILKVPLDWGGLWSFNNKINGIQYGWDMGHIELN